MVTNEGASLVGTVRTGCRCTRRHRRRTIAIRHAKAAHDHHPGRDALRPLIPTTALSVTPGASKEHIDAQDGSVHGAWEMAVVKRTLSRLSASIQRKRERTRALSAMCSE